MTNSRSTRTAGKDDAGAVEFQDAEGRDAGGHKESIKPWLQTFAGAL